MPLTPRQTRRVLLAAVGPTKKLSEIKNVLVTKYPKLAEDMDDDEIREILYDCSIHFKDDMRSNPKEEKEEGR